MFEALKRYADFQGRSGRAEYWMFALLVFLVALGFGLSNAILGAIGGSALRLLIGGLYALFILAIIIPSIAVGIRRLHDTDRSAWWLLISLIPVLGSVALVVFYCLPGTPGTNRFGPPAGAQHLQETFA
ncbi:MAG TPA: DUF805 domain-containing protein [Phenylobacterium sp.]